jgi:hypothetical protein
MKSIQTIRRLFFVAACVTPFMANASAVDFTRYVDRGFNQYKGDHRYSDTVSQKNKNPGFNRVSPQSTHSSCCNNSNLGWLSPVTSTNVELVNGNYSFGQFESAFNRLFTDNWTFSLAEDSQVNLSISSLNLSNLSKISDLQLQLFDGSKNLLGSITANHSLNLMLADDTQYSFTVSGAARGILGGFYLGNLQVCPPTAVPIIGALPMFSAALMLLGLRKRARSS